MVLLTKIYTKSGDTGKTSLGNGARVQKNSIRIDAIGTVDEANSCIGVALLYIEDEQIRTLLSKIQNNLFDLGADLCVPDPDETLDFKPLRIQPKQVTFLEESIDAYNANLAPLRSFILPGGTKASAYIHIARTVTRRAERLICGLKEEDETARIDHVLCYMNRLSDLLFVLGRVLNNSQDILWQPGA
ncbi:MAG: Cobalamin adenosyltransferase [Holosporales bacterium]